MTSVITTEYLEARRTAKLAQITACDAAITAVMSGAQSYSLDTGQTRQSVTKTTLGELRKMLQQLEADLQDLDDRIESTGQTTFGRPAC
jgi:hypothetical protein